MKKITLLFFCLLFCLSLSAAIIPVRDSLDKTVFDSPALLAGMEEDTPFGFKVSGYLDTDMFNFLTDPTKALSPLATQLEDFLNAKDDQYLYDNYEILSRIFNFDPSFPAISSSVDENAFYIRDYLENRFSSLDMGNRDLAVINAYKEGLGLFDSSSIKGELDASLSFYGGNISNGFGWNAGFYLIFDGVPSLFYDESSGDFKYGNDLYAMVRGDFGYGTFIGVDEDFAIGLSVSPSLIFRTISDTQYMLDAKVARSILPLFASNRFDLGFGIEMNLGFMFRANDEIRLVADLRNIPSMQTYWYFTAFDIASTTFQFHYDENLYYIPPDAAFTLLWDRGPWHIEFEISDILNQLLWVNQTTVGFDPFAIPKIGFSYDFNDDLSLGLRYEYKYIILGLDWTGLEIELKCALARLGFGLSVRYEM